MSRKRKKPGRKAKLRKKIKNLEWKIRVLGRIMLHTLEELQTAQRKLAALDAKRKRKRKRSSKCQSRDECVQAFHLAEAFRLSDSVPAEGQRELH